MQSGARLQLGRAMYPDHERLMARLTAPARLGRHLEPSQFPTFNLWLSGLTHLNPTTSRMTKTATTMLAVIISPTSCLFLIPGASRSSDYSAGTSPMDDWSANAGLSTNRATPLRLCGL
jgi:hypothetical protein